MYTRAFSVAEINFHLFNKMTKCDIVKLTEGGHLKESKLFNTEGDQKRLYPRIISISMKMTVRKIRIEGGGVRRRREDLLLYPEAFCSLDYE